MTKNNATFRLINKQPEKASIKFVNMNFLESNLSINGNAQMYINVSEYMYEIKKLNTKEKIRYKTLSFISYKLSNINNICLFLSDLGQNEI